MVGVGVLEAEVVFLDDVHGVEDPLVQLLAQGLFLQEVKLLLVHHANTEPKTLAGHHARPQRSTNHTNMTRRITLESTRERRGRCGHRVQLLCKRKGRICEPEPHQGSAGSPVWASADATDLLG